MTGVETAVSLPALGLRGDSSNPSRAMTARHFEQAGFRMLLA